MDDDDSGERSPTSGEINQIKVSVTCEMKPNVVIKLKRCDISEYEETSKEKTVATKKRKCDASNTTTMMTRAKRRKLNAETIQAIETTIETKSKSTNKETLERESTSSQNLSVAVVNTTETSCESSTQDKPIESERTSSENLTVAVVNTIETSDESSTDDKSIEANSTSSQILTIAKPLWSIDDAIWAKIRGSCHWPARIIKILPKKQFIVEWFNDYRTTRVFASQIYKFAPNIFMFQEKFDLVAGLREAAEEATLHMLRNRR